jgi:hypothetical protein
MWIAAVVNILQYEQEKCAVTCLKITCKRYFNVCVFHWLFTSVMRNRCCAAHRCATKFSPLIIIIMRNNYKNMNKYL